MLKFLPAIDRYIFRLVVMPMLGVFALVSNQTLLFGIALFGALVCYDERRKLRVDLTLSGVEYAIAEEKAERARREREMEREEKHAAEVDRVLAKIAREGMGSLTKGEKRVLERETERKAGG